MKRALIVTQVAGRLGAAHWPDRHRHGRVGASSAPGLPAGNTTTRPRPAGSEERTTAIRQTAVPLAIILAVALLVRCVLLVKARWMIDLDEALVGLMGRHILQGERPIFLNGQPYLGALEPYLAAALFAIVGASQPALKVIPLAIGLAWVLSTYLLARRLWDERAARLAAAAAAVPPVYVLSNTLKAWGATIETMALGNLILLGALACSTARGPRQQAVRAALLGSAIGFGFWLHWLIAPFVVGALGYLLIRRPALVGQPASWLALPAFMLGSLPFWIYNLRHEWATVRYLLGTGKPHGDGAGPLAILLDLLTRLIPRVFGAESPLPYWLAWPGVVVVLLALVWLIGQCLQARWRGRPSEAEVVALFVLAVPVLYLASGFGAAAINPWGIDSAGRYVVPIVVAGPLALAALARSASARLALAATVFVCLVNLAGILQADGTRVFQSPYYDRAPASFEPVVAALEQADIRFVWAEAGLGQPLMFASQERIVSADYWLEIAGGALRFPAAQAAVKRAERAAYVVAIQPGQIGPLEREFRRRQIPYRKIEVANLAILVPAWRVEPADIAAGLGHQY